MKIQRMMTWIVVTLTVVLLLLGILVHGFSAEVHQRFWADIFGRVHGPMTFRFFLQPTMALVAALPDGIGNARRDRSSFVRMNKDDRTLRQGRARQGLVSTARVVLLGISMDIIYQMREYDRFYPAEAAAMALLLALIPYFVFRWLIERMAGWWLYRRNAGHIGG